MGHTHDHGHDHGHGGKNTTSNNPSEAKSLGNQNYEVDDMGTDSTFKYSQLTGFPQETIVTKETEAELIPSEIKNGLYKRVILLRYNGIIKEVIPEEYDEWKDNLAVGIYTPLTFMWAIEDQGSMTEDEYNKQQMDSILNLVDGPLVSFVKSWFAPQFDERFDDSTPSVRLHIEPESYKTPLKKRF